MQVIVGRAAVGGPGHPTTFLVTQRNRHLIHVVATPMSVTTTGVVHMHQLHARGANVIDEGNRVAHPR